jgi:hypothetical protein
VAIAANPVLGSYVAPDLPSLPRYEGGLPSDVVAELEMRVPRCMQPTEFLSRASALDAWANALVVTSDPPVPPFARAATPPDVLARLERNATLVADLPVELTPAARPYEIFDLNYVPLGGLATLRRPGPRLRVWRVPEPRPPDRGPAAARTFPPPKALFHQIRSQFRRIRGVAPLRDRDRGSGGGSDEFDLRGARGP